MTPGMAPANIPKSEPSSEMQFISPIFPTSQFIWFPEPFTADVIPDGVPGAGTPLYYRPFNDHNGFTNFAVDQLKTKGTDYLNGPPNAKYDGGIWVGHGAVNFEGHTPEKLAEKSLGKRTALATCYGRPYAECVKALLNGDGDIITSEISDPIYNGEDTFMHKIGEDEIPANFRSCTADYKPTPWRYRLTMFTAGSTGFLLNAAVAGETSRTLQRNGLGRFESEVAGGLTGGAVGDVYFNALAGRRGMNLLKFNPVSAVVGVGIAARMDDMHVNQVNKEAWEAYRNGTLFPPGPSEISAAPPRTTFQNIIVDPYVNSRLWMHENGWFPYRETPQPFGGGPPGE